MVKKEIKKKISKKGKFVNPTLNWAFTKILPKVYERLNYTPQELWLKFQQYIERSDKNYEEITISGFAVYAQTARNYLADTKDSQEFSDTIDAIMCVFEGRYEQKAAKGQAMQYIMNNRFKGKRETLQKSEETHNVHPDVKSILDMIVYNGKKDGGK